MHQKKKKTFFKLILKMIIEEFSGKEKRKIMQNNFCNEDKRGKKEEFLLEGNIICNKILAKNFFVCLEFEDKEFHNEKTILL